MKATPLALLVPFLIPVLELGLRVPLGNMANANLYDMDPPGGRCVALKPDLALSYTGYYWRVSPSPMDTNHAGYRGPNRPQGPHPGTFRIAVLGDSFVYGQGVAADEAWPARIERELGPGVEVLNFGVPGFNLEEQATHYAEFVSEWAPDLVVSVVVDNDLDPALCASKHTPPPGWVLQDVYTARVGFMLYKTVTGRLLGERPDPAGLAAALSALDHTVEAPLAVLVLSDPLRSRPGQEDAASVLQATGLPWLDARSWIYDAQGETLSRIPREGHFDAAGNAVAGRRTASWLTTAGLAPPQALSTR